MRIGTWNLDQRSDPALRAAQLEAVEESHADIWVFTECPTEFVVGRERADSATYRGGSWSWVSIQGESVNELEHRFVQELGVAATVGVGDTTVTVVGSVLPWRSSVKTLAADREPKPSYRDLFDETLEDHLNGIDAARPRGGHVIWAGDFNQALEGPDWSGTVAGRKRLEAGLERREMVGYCRAVAHAGGLRTSIDHICGPDVSVRSVERFFINRRVSDHAGYVVDLDL